MQTTIDRPTRHSAPRRRLNRVVVSVIVLAMAVAATTVALLLQLSPGSRIDRALGQLRAWPSVAVTGYLTGDSEPIRMQATITADGTAQGLLSRPFDAQAEFVAGPAGTLLRGNAQWWLDEQPSRAEQLAGQWVRDPGGVVGRVALDHLNPAALSDALTGLRDSTGRTATQVDVNGSTGTAFVRDRFRLVVGWTGRPMALAIPTLSGSGARVGDTTTARTAPLLGTEPGTSEPVPGWNASIVVEQPAEDRAAATRRTVAEVLAKAAAQNPSGTVPTLDELVQQGSADQIVIEAQPDPEGCSPTRCTLRARVRNLGAVEQRGIFSVRINHATVSYLPLPIPPGGSVDMTTRPSPAFLAALPHTRVPIEYSFRAESGVKTDPALSSELLDRGLPADLLPDRPDGPAVQRAVERLTRPVRLLPAGRYQLEQAVELARAAAKNGSFAALSALTGPNRLLTDVDPFLLPAPDRPGGLETLRQVAQLATRQDVALGRWKGRSADFVLVNGAETGRPGGLRTVDMSVVEASTAAAFVDALRVVAARARHDMGDIERPDQLAVYLEIRPGAAAGMDAMTGPELHDRLVGMKAFGICQARDGVPAIDVVRIINQDPTGSADQMRGHEFRCDDLQA